MARKKRVVRAGFCYHVLLRGNGGQDIFRDISDRVRFCLFIQYASEQYQLLFHGFCLMNNHVHLLVQPLNVDLSSGIHSLAFRYAQYFNRKYQRQGYLYQGRFKAIIVQTGKYLVKLIRYIHLNPVRAHMVGSPEQYLWSSHLAYAGKASYSWLCQNLVLDVFGGSKERLLEYTSMSPEEAGQELFDIRQSMQCGAYGDVEFLELIHSKAHEGNSLLKCSDQHRPISLEKVIDVVCSNMNIDKNDLFSKSRHQQLIHARAAIAILTKKTSGDNLNILGKMMMRDPTSLAKLAKKMEGQPRIHSLVETLVSQLV